MNTTQDNSKADNRWLKLMKIGKRTRCHQMPERSFFYKNWQFPVCARCCGVFVGWLISISSIYFYKPNIFIILAFCLAMFLDWFFQYKNILASNNIRRLLTGILGGYALMSLYIVIIINIVSFIINLIK